ncbi:hypothetical protein COU78_02080 [Candidatus Peregrinibacteria bacterium CG10_big_fil_rev_8_21_14_0_10_49_24]|nr:MAG: hypothetical protein COV83_03680 [Candidatus Peregrinibacteria bacterium CG11_big_fil_rev_8_21_14_0_20_49_14]PIR51267.1 MAG: hypothetical protein COU78_02080 [Candidatus Peregrinibacteria bacterium CG10_big_fil_rev_8_21_14_0_10_49_24]PJA68075.1 MAG: hypothetical protein CO157_00845 [Candidatus Peregrinibacteria bacterium CG_4_9_14_3_um_filter_49_12]
MALLLGGIIWYNSRIILNKTHTHMLKHKRTILLRRLCATRRFYRLKKHPRRTCKTSWHPFASVSLSLVIATGVVAHQSISNAEHMPPLQNFTIRASDDTDMEVGQSIRLTAEGYYGTASVVVKAVWNLLGNSPLGFLTECEKGPTCTFVATNPGTAVVEAEANHAFAHVNIEIRGPASAQQNTFSDALPSWAANPILDLHRRSIIRGYEDGRFGSGDRLSRAQLITLIYRMLLNLQTVGEPRDCHAYYNDIPEEHFAYRAACLFWQHGWSTGLQNFDGDAYATRAETAQFMHRILGPALLNTWYLSLGDILDEGQIFSDVPVSHPVFYESAVLNRAGIMTGYPDGRFGADSTLNRAEAATVVHRALEKARTLNINLN